MILEDAELTPRTPDVGTGRQSTSQARRVRARSVRVLPAVISSSADHILVIMRETDVRHVSRVAKVTLMFGL